jgi:hypothetical protein
MTTLADATLALARARVLDDTFSAAFNAFLSAAASATVDERNVAIGAVLDGGADDPQMFGYLSNATGMLVEKGCDPRVGLGRILDARSGA